MNLENSPGIKPAVVIKGVIRTGCIELRKASVYLRIFAVGQHFKI